jgi:hypothetical protein
LVLQVQLPPWEPTSSISWDLSEYQVCDRSVAPRRRSAERRDGIQADARIVAPFLFTIDVEHLHAGIHASAEYVTGEYFRGLAVSPAAGRLIDSEDDRPGAAPVAVISFATSQNRFGGPPNAIGQSVLVDNISFTVIGVAPPEFFGVDPAVAPDLFLPLHTNVLVDGAGAARVYADGNFYWIEMMGRLRPGVSMAQAQAALAPRFHKWVATTAKTDGEHAKLPALILNPGAEGLGSRAASIRSLCT